MQAAAPGVKQQRLNHDQRPRSVGIARVATALLRCGEEYFACAPLRPEKRVGNRASHRRSPASEAVETQLLRRRSGHPLGA
jgi:hypothetical protein